jgi:hypothetical protein
LSIANTSIAPTKPRLREESFLLRKEVTTPNHCGSKVYDILLLPVFARRGKTGNKKESGYRSAEDETEPTSTTIGSM